MSDRTPLDLLTEDLLTMKEAVEQFPRRPHLSTVWRWVTRGVRGSKLETVKVGCITLTSRQAITRFLERTQ